MITTCASPEQPEMILVPRTEYVPAPSPVVLKPEKKGVPPTGIGAPAYQSNLNARTSALTETVGPPLAFAGSQFHPGADMAAVTIGTTLAFAILTVWGAEAQKLSRLSTATMV